MCVFRTLDVLRCDDDDEDDDAKPTTSRLADGAVSATKVKLTKIRLI